jgi:S1-C subfamily serine protease
MSTRGAILLAIGMLVLGLILGAVMGGAAGYLAALNTRAAVGQSAAPFTVPQFRSPLPFGPRGVPPTTNAVNGARVDQVTADSPAAKAGLQVGDVITAIDGTNIDQNHTLASLIQAKKPGDTVKLSVTRGNQNLTLSVTLGASSQNSSTAYLGVSYSPVFSGTTPRFRFRYPNG